MSRLHSGLGPHYFEVAENRSFLTIYGAVDMSINSTHAGGSKVWRVQSGNGWTSKLGLYGQESLGGGWTAFFRLESGINADNGAMQDASTVFNRASIIGLSHKDMGKLILGRQLSSFGTAGLGSDVFLANGQESIFTYLMNIRDLGGHPNSAAGNRLNDTVRYITPALFGKITIDSSLSMKQDRANGPAFHAKTIGMSYTSGMSGYSIGYAQTWCDPAVIGECIGQTRIAANSRTDSYIASMFSDFGSFVGNMAYVRIVPKESISGTANIYSVGLQKYMHSTLYRLSVGYRNTSIEKNYSFGATAGADHYLSRRTAIYGRIGLLKNGPNAALPYNYDMTSGNPAVARGGRVASFTVGISHHF